MELDEAVDGLGAAVTGTVGVEVAEELAAPPPQRRAETGDLRDRAGVQGGDDPLGVDAADGVAVLVVGSANLLGALPGELDLDVLVSGGERGVEPGALPVELSYFGIRSTQLYSP